MELKTNIVVEKIEIDVNSLVKVEAKDVLDITNAGMSVSQIADIFINNGPELVKQIATELINRDLVYSAIRHPDPDTTVCALSIMVVKPDHDN